MGSMREMGTAVTISIYGGEKTVAISVEESELAYEDLVDLFKDASVAIGYAPETVSEYFK